jgi:hypothetical protein
MADGEAQAANTNSPANPYGVFLTLINDGAWGVTGNLILKHNLKTGSQIPVEILAEVDRKIDDGLPFAGSFQATQFVPPGVGFVAPTYGNCTQAAAGAAGSGTGIASDVWGILGANPNCGATSLF